MGLSVRLGKRCLYPENAARPYGYMDRPGSSVLQETPEPVPGSRDGDRNPVAFLKRIGYSQNMGK